MKALVYGQENILNRLSASLKDEGLELKKAENNFYTSDTFRADEKFDLAIVDSRSETAILACRYIRENWDIPIVLVVDSLQANWKGLVPLDADGYIPEVKKGGELSARAKALLRRLFHRNKPAEDTPEEQLKENKDYIYVT